MSAWVFEPHPPSSVAIQGQKERFPVRRVLCVGRNYAKHAIESGADPTREPPFFFFKPTDALVDDGARVPYPPLTTNLHFEIELVVAIGTAGANITPADALSHVFGYAVGIDLTRRDLQASAIKAGHPWDWGKAFDQSAPCAPIHPVAEVGHPSRGRIWLAVNGDVKQDGNLAELIWPVPDIIAQASQAMRLEQGDLIYTGTPAGVGPVVRGDRITAGIDGVGELAIQIV
ncbi:MAG: fumarylacetoacetate hydrolase family protein [Acidobacteriota bacterium]